MKKKTISLLVILSLAAAGAVSAASTKCVVEKVDGDTVVMDCGKQASQLTAGQKVKVKVKGKAAAIEGC